MCQVTLPSQFQRMGINQQCNPLVTFGYFVADRESPYKQDSLVWSVNLFHSNKITQYEPTSI